MNLVKIIIVLAGLITLTVNSWAQSTAPNMGFTHLGAEYGAYDVDVSGGIKLGGVKKGGNRLGVPLGGAWRMALDPEKKGVQEGWFKQFPGEVSRSIQLPGTLDDAGVGEPMNPSIHVLTRKHEYIGQAWYQREIEIPDTWQGKQVQLWLDRVMWESRLYIDGVLVGSEDSLCTPHVYELGARLTPGTHTLTLRIDNSGRPGANAHGYGDDQQIRWNGVVGRMELIARDPVFIEHARTIADFAKKRVRVHLKLANLTGITARGDVTLEARLRGTSEIVGKNQGFFTVAGADSLLELSVPLDKNWRVWDEFDPALYELTATVRSETEAAKYQDTSLTRFGLREIGQNGTQFTLNGRTILLRGTHDGMGFPLLGHPAGEVESWRKIFRTVKDFGLNHVRYHSVCPNTPAFIAADEEGILLQPELPAWTKISESGAGQAFLQRELDRILFFYGNSPSFGMFSMGNEHAGDWDFLGRMVERAKLLDPTRRFVAASNEYIRPGERGVPVNPNDDFAVIMFGKEKDGKRPRIRYMERMTPGNEYFQRDADFRDIFADFKIPTISHELGQWWVYPDFKEIEKYTGVLRAKNLETFRDGVKAAGMLGQNEELRLASGRLAVELYKEEIERQFRTPGLGGFQLLDLRDYSGQSTALVGLLDAFWDSKGLITPADFRQFCAPTVLLARIPKMIYEEGDAVKIPLEVSHYGSAALKDAIIEWAFTAQDGNILAKGKTAPLVIPTGLNTSLGEVAFTVPAGAAKQVKLTTTVSGTGITNHWLLWTYPKTPAVAPGADRVRVIDTLDAASLDFVEKGGRALLIANNLDYQVPAYFTNPVWTPQNAIETAGQLIREKHGALTDFPTDSYSNFQWHNFLRPGRAFIHNEIPDLKPVIQVIDSPSVMRNFRLASVISVRLGMGALVLTSLDVRAARPEARQLRQSFINYLARGRFGDDDQLTRKQVGMLLKNPRFTSSTTDPKGQVVLQVAPSLNASKDGFNVWTSAADGVKISLPGFGYSFVTTSTRWGGKPPGDLVYKKAPVTAWSMNRVSLVLTCPKGFDGTIHLQFQDPENSSKRGGHVYGLGGSVMVDKLDSTPKWASFRIRAEDSSTGEVRLHFRKTIYGAGLASTPLVIGMMVTR